MDRSWVNYWIDFGLLASFLLAGITGIAKWPKLLPFFGISYSQVPIAFISNLHDWSGLVMVVLVIVHLILHWRWLVAMTKRIWVRK
jgi:hypothetical protein